LIQEVKHLSAETIIVAGRDFERADQILISIFGLRHSWLSLPGIAWLIACWRMSVLKIS